MLENIKAREEQNIDLEEIPLFAHLHKEQLESLRNHLQITRYGSGDVLMTEGERVGQRIFIILEGHVSLCKKVRLPYQGMDSVVELETRGKSDILGGVSVLDNKPLAVTVIAKTPVTIAVVDLHRRGGNGPSRATRNILIAELRRYLANYVRSSLDHRIDSLVKEAEFSRYRSAVGSIVITALSLLSFYTLALSSLPRFENYLDVNFALSPFIIIFFALIFFPVIRTSGFPSAFFGMRLDNWKSATLFSVSASLAFVAVGACLKWIIILASPSLRGMSVFSWADVSVGGMQVMQSPWYWFAVALYLVLTPVQEFVARCGIQAPLYAFAQGSEFKRAGLSILVSNLVFSAAHAHIGIAFALATFLPGLFWGWIFVRTNSLLAASLSHFIIGGMGIFLFGIQEFIQKLV